MTFHWINAKFLFLVTLCLVFRNVNSKTGPEHGKVVVCYVATWAVYRPGLGSFTIEDIDPTLCTHLIYSFAGLNATSDTLRSLDPWQDLRDDYGKGGYERLTGLRARAPHLRVSLAVGGWTEGSENYSHLAADPDRRRRFIHSVLEFIKKYNFDGLDLDWEFPGKRGGAPEDKRNFVLLVKELREEFDKRGLLLTAALGASRETIDLAYDIKQLSSLLDFFHLMCYDYHGSWDQKVGSNAPIKGDILSVESTVDYLLELGAPASKLILGIPFYGRTFIVEQSWTSVEGSDLPVGLAAKNAGFKGPFTREDGFMGYNEICSALNNATSPWESGWEAEGSQGIAWIRVGHNNDTLQVVTYDSTRSVANKMRYLVRRGLGGAMSWSVDTDDFHGSCPIPSNSDTYADFPLGGPTLNAGSRKYPLLRTINEGITVALEELEKEKENEVIPQQPDNNEVSGGFRIESVICMNILLILIALKA